MVVVIIVGLEITLRLGGYEHNSSYIMYDKDCYWRMAPRQKLNFKNKHSKRPSIAINSLGARGPEFKVDKPRGERRIICVGDSYTYGMGVSDEHTFPANLQRLIDKDYNNTRVINYGCNGHTILHETNFIKKYGLALSPDYVLVATSINTDFNEIKELEYNLKYMPTPGYNFTKFCIRKTAIGNILLKQWKSKKVKDILMHREEVSKSAVIEKGKKIAAEKNKVKIATADISKVKEERIIDDFGSKKLQQASKNSADKAFDIYIDKLDELVSFSKENNFKVVYIVMPWGVKSIDEAQIGGAYRQDDKTISVEKYLSILKNRYGDDIILIELMSHFNSKDLFLGDGHLNEKGNKLAATVMYEKIKNLLLKK